MKLNLGAGPEPRTNLEGFENLDMINGWRAEDGLDYRDDSIDAITISHLLMYVELEDWGRVFSEITRVLRHEGVVRITEDETSDPRSPRRGGFHDAVTLTSVAMVKNYLLGAGLTPFVVGPNETLYEDGSLMQRWHGQPPKVFFIEGVKP